MFDQKKIEEISRVSKAEKWAFPKTLNALKDADVDYYDVELSSGTITYFGKGQSAKESELAAFQHLPARGQFNVSGLKEAIHKHQVEKTPYADVVKEMVKAGVARYRVDVLKRTCTYFGNQVGEEYIETFP
jgi:uncharacterized protein YbcV (DUF1398 family)